MRIPWAVLAAAAWCGSRLGASAIDKSAGDESASAERPGALGSGGPLLDDAH